MQYNIDRNDPEFEKWGEPSIASMTEKAIQILQKNDNGYFLMVEGKCPWVVGNSKFEDLVLCHN